MPESAGERLAAVEASLNALVGYEHERWHKLNNDLQPIMLMPAQVARDIGRLEGHINGRIESAIKDFGKEIDAAIEPIRRDVDNLKTQMTEINSARSTWKLLLQSPLIGGLLGALTGFIIIVLSYFKAGGKG